MAIASVYGGMILAATGLAAALIAAASFVPDVAEMPAESTSSSAPPVIVSIVAGPRLPASLLSRLLDEASAIWRPSGFEFVWRRAAPEALPFTPSTEARPPSWSSLRLVIGDEPGLSQENRTPLGWIVFDGEHQPQPEIYLSYANTKALMEAARGVIGLIDQMPPVQREILLARAMGRALAHELGHFLLASKVHTPRGLLKAGRTAAELFATARGGFKIDAAQRQQIAARLHGDAVVVRR